MKSEERKELNTRYYKLGALEQALVTLRVQVCRPQDYKSLPNLTPMQTMMLLEAARLGAAQFHLHPELCDQHYYPMP